MFDLWVLVWGHLIKTTGDYQQSVLWAGNKKDDKMYHCKPQFYSVKMGLRWDLYQIGVVFFCCFFFCFFLWFLFE